MEKALVEKIKKNAAENFGGNLGLAICEHLGYSAAVRKAGGKVPAFLRYEVGQVKSAIKRAERKLAKLG